MSNLLDLVKDRAEAAEAELERVITEYNEDRDSCSTSSTEEKTSVSALSGVSVGSDDVFDSSAFEKAQVVNAPRDWEVLLHVHRAVITHLHLHVQCNGCYELQH